MKYLNDIYTGLHMALALAGIVILFLRPRFRGRGLLMAYVALSLLTQIGYFVPHLLLRNKAMEYETYEKYLNTAGIFLGLAGLAASVCLLVYIIGLKSVTTTTDTMTQNAPNKEEPKPTASNPALGFVLLVLAPVLYVILGFVSGAHGLPEVIGNPSPMSIAVALGCIAASVAAFAGKFRLK